MILLGLYLASVLLPTASAAHVYAPEVDERFGAVQARLEQAEATYGNRSEWDATRTQLARSAEMLLRNATEIAARELSRAAAALETGRARAAAQGQADPREAVREHADRLAHQAKSELAQVRAALNESATQGLRLQGLDDALLVAHAVLAAEDRLDVYQRARSAWTAGNQGDQTERAMVGGAAGAATWARLAGSMWPARANATQDGREVPREAISQLAHERAAHASEHASELTRKSQERVERLANRGRPLLSIAAFAVWAQDATFRDQTATPDRKRIDRLLDQEAPRVEAWLEKLEVEGDLARGAIESARTLSQGAETNQTRAFAASLVVLALEHTRVLVQTGEGDGGELATSLPPISADEAPLPGAWLAAGVVAVLVAAAGVWLFRRSRRT